MTHWLPEEFTAEMKEILGEEYSQYLDSFNRPAQKGLRVNTLKWGRKECMEKLPCKTEPVPWIPNGLFYNEQERLSKDPYYFAGLYYLQEPSAMTPAFLLPVEPGDMVLDICAAPGGKSTELGARLKGKGMLMANDISNSRAKALVKNLELFGITNGCVVNETPARLAQVFPGFFDKILVDAPCSGEGMFRKDRNMVKDWMEKGPGYYGKIQREIAGEAVRMLKRGGYLLYSTCTFSRLEDEGTVQWILDEFPEMELVFLEPFEGASRGLGLSGCIRLFPHKLRGEGHFMALLQKKGNGNGQQAAGKAKETTGKKAQAEGRRLPSELEGFLKSTGLKWELSRIRQMQDKVYYLPLGFSEGTGLRFLRTGLWMGTVKNGRFEPSQAMAMALNSRLYSNTVSFERDDPRVIRYLKGETISLGEGEGPVKGWCLICVDGFSLGFGKGNGMTIKNKYYAGWRWQ